MTVTSSALAKASSVSLQLDDMQLARGKTGEEDPRRKSHVMLLDMFIRFALSWLSGQADVIVDQSVRGPRYGSVHQYRVRVRRHSPLALTCSDMQRTVDFYTNMLGMKLVKTLEFTHDSGRGQHFFFDVGNGRDAIAFFWFDDAPPPRRGSRNRAAGSPGPTASAIGAMDHVALDVPRDKLEAYRDKLRAKGIAVTEVVNHSDRPGLAQYLPAEPNEDTFIRSICFSRSRRHHVGVRLLGSAAEADVVHEPKTAADLHYEKQVETVHRAQAAAEAAGLVPHAMPTH